jgi:soluble lytic murein transglycosylase-like protein
VSHKPPRVQFRPHHFLCTVGFRGKGYSDSFVENYQEIADHLRGPDGDNQEIQVVEETDSICAPCPNRREKLCTAQEKIESLDRRHAEALGVGEGDVLTWKEAKQRIKKNVDFETFERICDGCQWKDLGVCRESLAELRGKSDPAAQSSGASHLTKNPSSHRSSIGIALAIGVLAGTSFLALGAKSKPKAKPVAKKTIEQKAQELFVSVKDVEYLDRLLQRFEKQPQSASARRLRSSMRALDKGQYAKVRKLAAEFSRNELIGDYAPWMSGQAFLAEGRRALKRKQYKTAQTKASAALGQFLLIERQHPTSRLLEEVPNQLAAAELLIAEAMSARRRPRGTKIHYQNAFSRMWKSELVKVIRPYQLGQYARACKKSWDLLCATWIRRLAKAYRDPTPEYRALRKQIPEIKALPAGANEVTRVRRVYKGEPPDREMFLLAMQEYYDRDYDDAAEKMLQMIKEYPDSKDRHRALYWLAESLRLDDEEDEAKFYYDEILAEAPMSYYGLLAAYATKRKPESFIDATLPEASRFDPVMLPYELRFLRRAEMLLGVGLRGMAARELKQIKPRNDMSSPFLMYVAALADQTGSHLTAFRFLTNLFLRGYQGVNSTYGLRMVFPFRYEKLIQKYSDQVGIDAILVLSLIKQESAFRTYARSGSGAMGLMQLMPMTANDVDPKVEQRDVYSSATNIRLGTLYLKRLLKRFDGNIALSLAGYNAGPTRVSRWRRAADPELSMTEWIETIPYEETRGYVSTIIRNYYWYSYLLYGTRFKDLGYFWGKKGPIVSSTQIWPKPKKKAPVQAKPSPKKAGG